MAGSCNSRNTRRTRHDGHSSLPRPFLVGLLLSVNGAAGRPVADGRARKRRLFPRAPAAASPKRLRADIAKGTIPGAVLLISRHGKIAYFEAMGSLDPREEDADDQGCDLPHLLDDASRSPRWRP